jgi:transcriptional regulator with XRE-family HTH domain
MSFQEKLQVLRRERGLSQENLAESIGISRQAIAKWESGKSYPDINNLIQLSDLFKVSIDKLVRDEDSGGCFKSKDGHINEMGGEIIEFLCRAKKSTYAGKGVEVAPSRPNSHDLHYCEGNLKYIDTYLGGKNFAGEEALWEEDTAIWSMNYIGRILADGFSGDFLKEALRLVPKEQPYRGPMVYENGEYKYHCIIKGEFKWFEGYEEIFYNDKKIYECNFNGGSIR